MKRIVVNIVKILNGIILVLLICLSSFFIYKRVIKKENPAFLFNYTYLEVSSNSMQPKFSKDNIIIIKKAKDYKVNDIVTYRYSTSLITHKIVNIKGNTVLTMGINNNNAIDKPITKDDIIGKLVMVIPFNKVGMLVIIITFIVVLLLIEKALKSDKSNSKLLISAILLFNVGIIFIPKTLARYMLEANATLALENAIILTDSNLTENISLFLGNMAPGENKTFNFAVSNYSSNENSINIIDSEVSLNYTIKVLKSDNIPLSFSLYKNSGQSNILINNETDEQFMDYRNQVLDNYSLIVSWNQLNNSADYANKVDYIDIVVESKQVI